MAMKKPSYEKNKEYQALLLKLNMPVCGTQKQGEKNTGKEAQRTWKKSKAR